MTTVTTSAPATTCGVGDEQAGGVDAETGPAAAAVFDVDGGRLAEFADFGAGQAVVGRDGGGEGREGQQTHGRSEGSHGRRPHGFSERSSKG